jgi:hypothetical protein
LNTQESCVVVVAVVVVVIHKRVVYLCIIERKKDPYTPPAHTGTIHEQVELIGLFNIFLCISMGEKRDSSKLARRKMTVLIRMGAVISAGCDVLGCGGAAQLMGCSQNNSTNPYGGHRSGATDAAVHGWLLKPQLLEAKAITPKICLLA